MHGVRPPKPEFVFPRSMLRFGIDTERQLGGRRRLFTRPQEIGSHCPAHLPLVRFMRTKRKTVAIPFRGEGRRGQRGVVRCPPPTGLVCLPMRSCRCPPSCETQAVAPGAKACSSEPRSKYSDEQSCFSVIARSACDEAIHLTACAELDCFAALAMTHSNTLSHWLLYRAGSQDEG